VFSFLNHREEIDHDLRRGQEIYQANAAGQELVLP
jgi:hypothetical protein